jgi:hypothetical protein
MVTLYLRRRRGMLERRALAAVRDDDNFNMQSRQTRDLAGRLT